jgi:hypothetical protein
MIFEKVRNYIARKVGKERGLLRYWEGQQEIEVRVIQSVPNCFAP